MKGESITKKVLKGLLLVGAIYVAASSPYFAFYLSRNLRKVLGEKKPIKKKDPRFKNAFYYLKNRGYLDIRKKNHQIYIALTKQGRKRAGKYLIDDLNIKKPRKWDKKYRIVFFDIPNITRIKRDALRGKLKELGFFRLQQSVWVYPYECRKEIDLLREFFGLKKEELILITGEIENDRFLRRYFKI
ncbi:CRISPR-associated endonuclease Cas2 [bacterium]|nr:CRISPR-associated endonuclease Cas2 [bacterium]